MLLTKTRGGPDDTIHLKIAVVAVSPVHANAGSNVTKPLRSSNSTNNYGQRPPARHGVARPQVQIVEVERVSHFRVMRRLVQRARHS